MQAFIAAVPLLTVEKALFAGVVALALFVRLVGLDATALTPDEARRAFAGWQLAQGQPPGWWDAPAWVLSTAGIFFVFGSSDIAARLVSVLAGVGLVAAVWLLRPWLGNVPTLAAAALIALSPSAIAVSRTAREDSLAMLVAMVLGISALRALSGGRRAALLAAMSLAVLLNLGQPGFSAVLVLLFFGVVSYAVAPDSLTKESLGAFREWLAIWLPALAVFLLLSTGFLLNLGGLGLSALPAWVGGFESILGVSWYHSGALLLGYELPVVLAGTVAVVAALRRWVAEPGEPAGRVLGFLAVWALGGSLLLFFGGRASISSIAFAALPLTLLSGWWLGRALAGLGQGLGPVLQVAGPVVALLGFAFISIGKATSIEQDRWLALAPALVALVVAVLALWLVAQGAAKASGPLSAAALEAALLLMAHNASGLVAAPLEPLATRVSPETVATLTERLSLTPYTDPKGTQLAVAVEESLREPLEWYLRGLPGVSWVSSVQAGPDLMVARAADSLYRFTAYSQSRYTLEEFWTPTALGWGELWRWLSYRDLPREGIISQQIALLRRT